MRRSSRLGGIARRDLLRAGFGSLVLGASGNFERSPFWAQASAAQFDLAAMVVLGANAKTASDAVDHLLTRLLRVPVDTEVRRVLIELFEREIGTSDITLAATYLERPLRLVAHLIMSSPQYQLC